MQLPSACVTVTQGLSTTLKTLGLQEKQILFYVQVSFRQRFRFSINTQSIQISSQILL